MELRKRTTPRLVRIARVVVFLGVFASLLGPWTDGRAGEGFALLFGITFWSGVLTAGFAAIVVVVILVAWVFVFIEAEPDSAALGLFRLSLAALSIGAVGNYSYFYEPPLVDNWGYRVCAVFVVAGAALEGVLLWLGAFSPPLGVRRF